MKRVNWKHMLSLALVIALVLSLLPLGAAFADATVKVEAGKAATTTGLNFRVGPGLNQPVKMVLKKNTEVTILKKSGSWYQVQLSNGTKGYVFGKYLKITATASPVIPVPAKTTGKLEADMVLATTTSTQDTGLLDVLIPAFEKKTGVKVKTVAVGSGAAMDMGKKGDADVLLVHSRAAEDAFVNEGFGINRKDVMYNEFFLVGPKNDPAGVLATKTAADAFKKIANDKATFISRADKSGTHSKELTVWKKAALAPTGKTDKWYIEAGQGMGATLTMADEMKAYTLVDSGTWFAYMDKVNLKIVSQGDNALFNPYGVIEVSPAKYPNIHHNAAAAFSDFITSPEGQKIIKGFMKNGQQLFIPDAK